MSISKVTISDTTHDIVAGGITYCTCDTSADTTAKVATVASGNFSLFIGATVNVKFTKANTIASPTLNVANTGAKAIYWHGGPITSSQYWEANSVLNFIYNGNQWELVSVAKDNNTIYGVATSSSLGLVKSGADITVDANGNVSVNDDSHNHIISNVDGLETALNEKVPASRTIAGVDLADNITKNELNLALNNAIVITNNDVTVTTDSTKGTAPYNTSYGYTNITVNILNENDLHEDLLLLFMCTGSLVVASATRNVRIRFGSFGQWIPLYYTTSVASGSTYMATNQSRFVYYSTKIISSGAFHILTDNNSTYSPASLGFGYGTCSTAAETVAKTASLSSYTLTTGGRVSVRFTNGITVANPTLNINSKGAKAIYFNGSALTDTTLIKAGDVVTFVYRTYYYITAINGSVVTSGTYGPTANATPSYGGTFNVPSITVDKTGRATGISTKTVTIPSATATTSANGLMSSSDKTKLNGVHTGAVNITVSSTQPTNQSTGDLWYKVIS